MPSSASRLAALFLFVVLGILSPCLYAAQVSITATPAPGSTNRSYILVVDGNGLMARYTGTLHPTTGRAELIDLPVGDGYRFRMLVGTQSTGNFVASGKALNVSVTEGGANSVTIPYSAPSVRRVEAPSSPVPAGTMFTLAYEITDTSEYFADASETWLWGSTVNVFESGYVIEDRRRDTAIARGRIQRVGADLYRVTYDRVPAPPAASRALYTVGVQSEHFPPNAASALPVISTGAFLSQRSQEFLEFSAPLQGVTLTDNTAQTITAVIDGAGFVLRAAGVSPLQIGLPPGVGYRVRYYSAPGNRLATGRNEDVIVNDGTFTPVAVAREPWSVVPYPGNPTAVDAGQIYTLKFTMVDAGRIFERTSDLILASLNEIPASQNARGGVIAASITALDARTSQVVFQLQAPQVPRSEPFQIIGVPRLSWGRVNSFPQFYSPDRQLGDAPLSIEYTGIRSGIDVTVAGISAPANRVSVVIDAPGYRVVQGADVVNGVARVAFGVPPGTSYRVRAVAGDVSRAPHAVVGVGVASDVFVPLESLVPVQLNLVRPRLSFEAEISETVEPYNRLVVAQGESYALKFRVFLPKGFVSSSLSPFNLNRRAGEVGDSSFTPIRQDLYDDSVDLIYELTPSAATAATVLSHALWAPLLEFNLSADAIPFAPTLSVLEFGDPLGKIDLVPGGPPVAKDPEPRTLYSKEGNWTTISASFSGAPQPRYEWRKNGVPLVNPKVLSTRERTSLVFESLQASDRGEYSVVATNAFGSATSPAIKLGLLTDPRPVASRLVNLSVRSRSGQGADTLIVGFVVGGEGTVGNKTLLVRGMGPALAKDVPGFLPNPMLTLYEGQEARMSNDDWGGGPALKTLAERLGAFAFAHDASTDAALASSDFGARPYTAHVGGVGGTTGEALAEIYDGDSAVDDFTPRLMNLSARVQLRTPDEVLIGGFVIGGTGRKRVLIRAIGPGLAQHQVTDFMADPVMSLYSGSKVLGGNDDWSAAALGFITGRVGASPIAEGSKDSVMLVELAPGPYTVHVKGSKGATGIVLLELYDAD